MYKIRGHEMGRMRDIPSIRRRNKGQKRRLRIGLVTGLIAGVAALLIFAVPALDRKGTLLKAAGVRDADILVESYRELPEYLASGDVHTVTGDILAVNSSGTSYDYDSAGTVTPSSAAVTEGGSVTLKASPNPGFSFVEWRVTQGGTTKKVSDNSTLTLSNVTGDAAYTAVFKLTAVHVTYKNVFQSGSTWTAGGGNITDMQGYIPVSSTGEAELTCNAVADPTYKLAASDCWTFDYTFINGDTWTEKYSGNPQSIHIQENVVSIVATARYVKSDADLVTIAVGPSGLGYIISGNYRESSLPSNGSSYATARPDSSGVCTFTLVMPKKDDCSIRGIYDADTGEAQVNNGNALIGWYEYSGRKETGERYIYTIKVYPGRGTGRNFIINLKKNSDEFHMGSIITVARPVEGGITGGDVSAESTQTTMNTTLNASPNKGYMFDHWEYHDINGNFCTSTKQTLPVSMSGFHIFTAVFSKDGYEVKGVCDPEAGGTISGTGKYDTHSDATVTAVPLEGYLFDKWTWKTKDEVDHEDKSNPFTIRDITEDYNLTAHFKKANPGITLIASPVGANSDNTDYNTATMSDGQNKYTTSVSGSVEGKVASGSNLTLQAFPNTDEDYVFSYWVDQDGNTSTSNPYVVGSVKDDTVFTAIFTRKNDRNGIKVLASPPSGGSVSAKKTGTGGYTLSAKAQKGYKFLYWKCADTSSILTKETSYTITEDEVKKGYTYIAYFEGSGEKVTSELVNEHFPDIRRFFSQPNYKYTRDYWISYVREFTGALRVGSDKATGVPGSYSAYAKAEAAMKEKAEDAGRVVITARSELITTDNEIIPISSDIDHADAKASADEITQWKFGNEYGAEILCVKNVTAPEGFTDGVRTYLWYNTDAHWGDNLFIIYDHDGKEQTVTPVCDPEGTLTFTLDNLGSSNRFALVRVNIL